MFAHIKMTLHHVILKKMNTQTW